MDSLVMNNVKDELMKENPEFRDLVQQHQNFEKRLSELANLHYPSDEEQIEESLIKKKKLAVKDEIYAMILEYSQKHNISH
ncbi:MAG TPA: YdcH family protein [Pyrinomonadaceae bacterium]|nr:YdcH family protein [Pyrinomonadaceae bacterium]